ncbi:hypothetical protein HG15A2_32120 [Adhaeretor mobilis]|uniref:Uncharacterized protein n=1 Tax=Adhaeretor mobilis TaxID=1930276 RepID=A0A517MYC3_9BACT|nr:hypothetical protein HG15A2_32120 [Adhaeretor mobilis]
MPNGKPGDHPLTDILHNNLTVYSAEIDQRIRVLVEELPNNSPIYERLHLLLTRYSWDFNKINLELLAKELSVLEQERSG